MNLKRHIVGLKAHLSTIIKVVKSTLFSSNKPKSRQAIIVLLEQYFRDQPVKEIALFGSVARNEHRKESDIDVMVTFKEDYKPTLFDLIQYKDDLSQLTGQSVDIVHKGSAYSHIRESYEQDKIVIYG